LGRPPKNMVAMTGRERTSRWRATRREKAIDAATVQQWFRCAIGKSHLRVPELDECDKIAKGISVYAALGRLGPPEAGPAWHLPANYSALVANIAWRGKSTSRKENAPTCVFVHSVIKHLGYTKTASAISAVLRGRRGGKIPRLNFGGDTAQAPDPVRELCDLVESLAAVCGTVLSVVALPGGNGARPLGAPYRADNEVTKPGFRHKGAFFWAARRKIWSR
jgi:hypothetical protein